MNNSFIWFLVFCLVVWGGSLLLWRRTIGVIGRQVADHARLNARAYIRGAVYVAISVGTAFKETFEKLSSDEAAVLPWWSWLIRFMIPVLAGLVTLGAFLDNSANRNLPVPPKPNS